MANFDLERIRIESGARGLEHHPQIGSTNDRGLELVRLHANSEIGLRFPFLILADHQIAGRGQRHRPWIAETGSLTCSLVLTHQEQVDSLVPLAVGLAVCEAIEKIADNIQVELKWPNDLLIGKRKLGGILVEQFAGSLVIGIGVNVNQHIELGPTELHPATDRNPGLQKFDLDSISLSEAHGRVVNLTELIIETVKQVIAKIELIESDRQRVLDRCHQRMIFRDREIELLLADGEILMGHYRGLNVAGQLLIESQGNPVAVASALAIRW